MTPEMALERAEQKEEQKTVAQGVKRLALEDKLGLVKTKKSPISHIKIDKKLCKKCSYKTCLIVCPAKTYEERNGTIEAAYENCLECGSCRVACADGAITWEYPSGGFGVTFING